jgi:hypothetical protein
MHLCFVSFATFVQDDPQGHAEYLVGTWQMRFAGEANVTCDVDPNAGCAWQLSDQVVGTDGYTYLNITMPAEHYKPELNLMLLNFTNTKRSASSPLGSGVTNISLILPNHTFADGPLDTDAQFFADWGIATVKQIPKLNHARFMGAMATNYEAGFYGDTGHHIFEWDQRTLPTDASWSYNNRNNPQNAMPWGETVSLDASEPVGAVLLVSSSGLRGGGIPDH